jgi:hypothetical protein
MKKKVVNHALMVLVLLVCFGLFQAWKESKNPFIFYSNNKKMIEKSKYESNKPTKFDSKKDYTIKLSFLN